MAINNPPRTLVVFSSSQVIEIIDGMTWRMLDHWARLGMLSLPNTPGRGVPRTFSFSDLVALQTLTLMRSWGVNLESLRDVTSFIHDLGTKGEIDDDDAYLVVTSAGVTITRSDYTQPILNEVAGTSGHVAWVLDLGTIVRTLRAKTRHYFEQRSA